MITEGSSTNHPPPRPVGPAEKQAARLQHLEALINSSVDGILVFDEDQKIVLFNSAAEKLFRCPASEALNTDLDRFIPVAAPEKHRNLVSTFGSSAANLRTIEAPALDLLCVRADGTEFRGEVSISRHTREGQPAYAAIIRDATRRLESERTGAESETNWRALFENMLEGVAHCRLDYVDGQPVDFTYIRVNPAFGTLTGISDVEGKRASDVIPGFAVDNREFLADCADVAATGVPRKLETVFPGIGRWFSVALYTPGPGEVIAVFDNITARRQAEERMQRQLEHVSALRDIDLTLVGSVDLRVTLSGVVSHAIRELGLDAACILLLDTTMQTLQCVASAGFRTQALQRLDIPAREGLAGRLAAIPSLGQIAAARPMESVFAGAPGFADEGFDTYVSMPIMAKAEFKGVMEVYLRSPFSPDGDWLEFLGALGGQVAVAIDSASLFDQLQRSHNDILQAYDATIEGWSRALDLRDRETEGHTQRVTRMTIELARALGMPDEQLVHARRGGLLHDIGKLGVPDSILLKRGPLTDEEWVLMKQHPSLAYGMLAPVDYLRPAVDIPWCHHEKWDGSGYPRGLKGEQIPLQARIFAVADVYDALTSDRPYRPGWTEQRALEQIRADSGTHFDPVVVDAFLRYILPPGPA